MRQRFFARKDLQAGLCVLCMVVGAPEPWAASAERGPRSQPGADMSLYAPEQHALYDGQFKITGRRVYQAGLLGEAAPWDHMDNDATNLREVEGEIVFDVETLNTVMKQIGRIKGILSVERLRA